MNKLTSNLAVLLALITLGGWISSDSVIPPTLRSRHTPGVGLYAGFRQPRDSAIVITVKFKLTETGFLDTLAITGNAPAGYFEKIQNQLVELNGKWIPQMRNGKAEKSKWLIYRCYVVGPNSRNNRAWEEVEKAYQRDYGLFGCYRDKERGMQCVIEYLEGADCFVFPPRWYSTVH
ncbi:hypothetical protein [Spirosoma sp.]|uniref:hypothetical protein n=1 Tax=Spirosoma sp. TaxID=1899569 RepID=UPI003B3B947E